jgi:molybdenum cofactor cytidylyltransferase
MLMISGILLSAGSSSRFGSPKALASIDHMPAIIYLLEKLITTSLDEIIVVLGADSQQIEPCLFKHKKIRVVHNKDYKFGQTSSVQTGLRSLAPDASGFMILPVDCPFIQEYTVDAVIARFKLDRPPGVIIPAYQNHRGHPPVFDIRFKDEILKLDPSHGINEVLHAHPASVITFEFDDPGIAQSFNTPEEFKEIKKIFQIA